MKKRVMSIILCVVILVTSGISCFAASVNETSDTSNGNTIKYLKSEEGHDYGNTAYIIRDKETKQIIPLSVGPLDGYSYAYLPENSDFTVEKVEKYTTPFNDLGEKYKYDSYINEITAREVVVGFEDGTSPLSLGRDSVNKGLFYDCPLDSVYIGRELTYQNTKAYGYSPFYRSPTLRSIVISDVPTKVETNEFYGCTNLYYVKIGNGAQSIGDYAFSGCSSIDYFSFGSQVQTIGAEAFSDCVAMTQLYSYCQQPPICGASALADIDKWSCTLYIPDGTLSAYTAADQWMDFFFVEENSEKFTITWKNDDGSIIDQTEVSYGQIPIHAEPVKPSTEQYTYSFAGWTPEVVAVTGDATYTATYTQELRKYTVTFLDEDGTILSSQDWEYGTMPTCEAPTKPATAQYTYTFAGWTPEVVAVTEDATYTATFTAEPIIGTDIPDIQVEPQAKKVVREGKVLIIRGDKTYTITGEIVK